MRLVDADEIADSLKNWFIMNRYYHPYSKSNLIPATEVKDIIDRSPTISEWIPVSERLPDKREESYWCCSEGGYQFQCRWTNDMYGLGANEYSEWGWHVMDKPQYSRVIAWMPLPEPYKAERGEG